MASPLEGLLVADFSRVLAGPLATMMLGDLGADVVKVERPRTGDDTRAWGPPWRDGEATYYLGLNRNKRSVALDLADPGDLALARRLAERADVLVESFRPGLMARWGLDGATLRAANPRLVSCSVTAFGSGQRAAGLPGYDFLLQAMGGLMSITGEAEGRPLKVGAAVVDLVCGLHAVAGILAALREREATGAGSHVEVSLMDAALTCLLNQGSGWVLADALPRRRGNRHPSIVPYETYEAADRPFAVAAGNDRLFARLCESVGEPELARDERFATNAARVEHVDALGERLEAAFARAPAEHWVARLRAANVPVGPINDVAEAYALAEELGLAPVDRSTRVPLPAPPLGAVRRPPPRLDEHGEELRGWLAGAHDGALLVRPLRDDDAPWRDERLRERWGATVVVSRGQAKDAAALPGFVAERAGERIGLATYRLDDGECELVTLDALVPSAGVGTALVEAVAAVAGDRRLWLVTTNDNLRALRFYQRRGFVLVALRPRALDAVRALKPEVPATGLDGIPLRDELELAREA